MLENGAFSQTIVDGVTFQPAGGDVVIARVTSDAGETHAEMLFAGGQAAFLPGCRAREADFVYDDREAPITVAAYPSPYGGEPLAQGGSGGLDATPLPDSYWRGVLAAPDAEAAIERIVVGGGTPGDSPTTTALREIAFR